MDSTATTPPALTVTSTQRLTVVRTQDRAAGSGDMAVMSMLQDHVPLALLCDLTSKDGPCSEEILAREGVPETDWWVQ